ncbi:MAG: endonuclease/exonuclease/phosphatase family protein [Geminicoccaceae bacterium]|nr:endonuclease/exonuclease/phosphatase family protein [Geminicoccaceae bacterium]MCX8100966.1 endonuclease/exonuclease/phosphatase family protein [Geminicoccaceae bacterium]MDW8371750.1 endonuclease/exonuclease/phosphatase family protein [Geminicoccaceae bacterium]
MRLRLATFNLENLGGREGEAGLAERIAVLRPQLLRLDADILCLQEIHGARPAGGGPRRLLALEALLDGTPYARFERASTRSPGEHGSEGWVADIHNLVVLSRFPVRSVRELRHERVPPLPFRLSTARPEPVEVLARFERPALLLEVELPGGRPLHLVNLHLKAPLASFVPGQKLGPFAWASVAGWAEGYFLAATQRAAQALEVRLALDALFDAEPEAHVAVAGDLNAEDRETPLRLLCAETADTGNGELAPRSLVPTCRSLPEERRFTAIHHGRRLTLDHILLSRPLLAFFRGLEVHNETLDDELAPSERVERATESYHAPVVASFAFP